MKRRTLSQVYADVPEVHCKGLCQEYCGPIGMSTEEARILKRQLNLPVLQVKEDMSCPALTADGKCKAYYFRPLVCRMWGVVDVPPMRCPHGCVPDRFLTEEESHGLMLETVAGAHDFTITHSLAFATSKIGVAQSIRDKAKN